MTRGGQMLQVFAFHRIGVALSDLYFVDPNPSPGQEGAERGVRLEVRFVELQHQEGTIYASRPILVGRPIWRADLLETADGPPGSFDRTHHHPRMRGWEPDRRRFEPELSADPLPWVAGRLGDLDRLLADAGLSTDDADPADAAALKSAVPDIVAALERLLADVHAGRRALAPAGGPVESARESWL